MGACSPACAARRHGFTLIELLVVIAIIAVLIALLVAGRAGGTRGRAADPVRQQSQAARPGDAQLRELQRRPAAPDGPDVQQCGCGGLEVELGRLVADHSLSGAGNLYNAINYTNKTTDPSNATAVSTQLKVFLCPSEVNQQAFTSTSTAGVTSTYGVSNYGWCEGTWYTFGGFGRRCRTRVRSARTSAARSLRSPRPEQYTAGPEVKTYTPAYHDCGAVPPPGPTGPPPTPTSRPCSRASRRPRRRGASSPRGPRACPAAAIPTGATATRSTMASPRPCPPTPCRPPGRRPLDSDMSSEDEDDGGPDLRRQSPRAATIPAASTPSSPTAACTSSRTRSTSDLAQPGNGRRRRGHLVRLY